MNINMNMEEDRLSTLDLLDQLEEIFLDGNRIPFSGNRLVNEQDAIDHLDEIRESMPKSIVQATEIIKQGDYFINKSKARAEEIVKIAKAERNKLVDSAAVRKEAERQIAELQYYSKQKCESLLKESRQKGTLIENEIKQNISKLEKTYIIKKQRLEDEYINRRKELELECLELNKDLKKRFDNNNQKAIEQLEQFHREGKQIKAESQKEAQKVHNEAINYRQNTQKQCEALILQSRNEAASLQEGANRYAEQTLKELENRLHDINQVVLAGRTELSKIQSINSIRHQKGNNNENNKSVPFTNIRNQASKLKSSIRNIG